MGRIHGIPPWSSQDVKLSATYSPAARTRRCNRCRLMKDCAARGYLYFRLTVPLGTGRPAAAAGHAQATDSIVEERRSSLLLQYAGMTSNAAKKSAKPASKGKTSRSTPSLLKVCVLPPVLSFGSDIL